jgi:hypothetical protein
MTFREAKQLGVGARLRVKFTGEPVKVVKVSLIGDSAVIVCTTRKGIEVAYPHFELRKEVSFAGPAGRDLS